MIGSSGLFSMKLEMLLFVNRLTGVITLSSGMLGVIGLLLRSFRVVWPTLPNAILVSGAINTWFTLLFAITGSTGATF